MSTTKTLTTKELKILQQCLTQITAFEINEGQIKSLKLEYGANKDISISLEFVPTEIVEEVATEPE